MTIEARLDATKREFYAALLSDATLTLLVLGALDAEDSPVSASQLSEFAAEPWRPSRGETQPLGLRFTRSMSAGVEELGFSLGVYSYLEVLSITTRRSDATLLIGSDDAMFLDSSAALMGLDVGSDQRKQAAKWFMTNWQVFLQRAITLGATLDPMTGTFTTEERHYVQ